MKNKATWIIWVVLLSLLLLGACADGSNQSEASGVPDALVQSSEVYIDFEQDYTISDYQIFHDVDMDTHIDDVTLKLCSEHGYMTIKCEAYLTYQYNKSDDIWILVDYDTGNYETSLNAEEFIRNSAWSGVHNNSSTLAYYENSFTYTIHIKELSPEFGTISVCYEIDFDNDVYDDMIQTAPVTLELGQGFGGSVYLFRINEEGKELPWERGVTFYLSEDGLTENNYN